MNKAFKIQILERMLLIRYFEEILAEHKWAGKILGPFHCCVGQEAVSAGICGALAETDYIIGNHRSHGYMLGKGANVNKLVAEIFGKVTGTNGGKGGSMHINDISVGGIGSSAIVGSSIPVACGAALASKYQKNGRVSCVFFGDGAANEGVLYESLNLAAVWKLPVLFVLENNGYAITTSLSQVSSSVDLYQRAIPFGVRSFQVDGQDVNAVYEKATEAIEYMRRGEGPVFIEAKTYRFREHQEGAAYAKMTEAGYRDLNEVQHWKENKDPIRNYANQLLQSEIISEKDYEGIQANMRKKIEDAIVFAEESAIPEIEDVYKNIYC